MIYIDRVRLFSDPPEDNYLSRLPVIKNLKRQNGLRFENDITFLVGENGIGKSTLLEGIAVASGFNPEGGTKNFNFSTVNTHSDLHRYIRVSRTHRERDGFFLRAESFYNVASNIDEMDRGPSLGGKVIDSYGGVSLHHQSHGESFLSLVLNRFGGNGLYLLDEPEAALSPRNLMVLMAAMEDLRRNHNAQFIVATHSPMLMAMPGTTVLELREDAIEEVSYLDTEHYRLTKSFLETPERLFRYLTEE